MFDSLCFVKPKPDHATGRKETDGHLRFHFLSESYFFLLSEPNIKGTTFSPSISEPKIEDVTRQLHSHLRLRNGNVGRADGESPRPGGLRIGRRPEALPTTPKLPSERRFRGHRGHHDKRQHGEDARVFLPDLVAHVVTSGAVRPRLAHEGSTLEFFVELKMHAR